MLNRIPAPVHHLRALSTTTDTNPGIPSGGRLASIDALRGFDMFWIIGGGRLFASLASVWPNETTYEVRRQLRHVRWEGFHFEDLIYPLFLFLIGVVLPFSFARRQAEGQSASRMYRHFLQRSALLVLLGAISEGLLTFDEWPTLDAVLLHIGLCYLPAAILVWHTSWRTRAIIVGVYLTGYWLASILIPVPGHGAGVFTQDGSLASFLDHCLISGRLPNEGPTSILSGVTTILGGSLAGSWLRSDRTGNHKALGLAFAGLAAVALGFAWSFSFPMIKRIVWSSSYVVAACGWSLLLLAGFYWLIDVKGHRRWSFFFVVIGMNAIAIYFLQSIVNFRDVAWWFVGGIAKHAGDLSPLVLPLGTLAIKWCLLWFMFKRRIFFKL